MREGRIGFLFPAELAREVRRVADAEFNDDPVVIRRCVAQVLSRVGKGSLSVPGHLQFLSCGEGCGERFTVCFPPPVAARVRRLAARSGLRIGALVRVAVAMELGFCPEREACGG